jgi:benzil reductase ((S)-benzoin forming)
MASYFYVTGASRGLGRAIVERILAQEDAYVLGVSREQAFQHPRYTHITLDLTDLHAVSEFQFGVHPGAGRIVLVNNAGMLVPHPLQAETTDSIAQNYAVNIVAPTMLMASFLRAYQGSDAERVVCNVTSSAANRPIAGGSLYCSAKAALDMTTRVVVEEIRESGDTRLHVFGADPGSMDTDMQLGLRESSASDFPQVDYNRRLKAEGRLHAPADVAGQLIRVLMEPSLAPDVIFRLADPAESSG